MTGQWGPKYVGVDVLERFCNSNKERAFVGAYWNYWIVMHGMENVKLVHIIQSVFVLYKT
jgi:hypothetical protein